MRFQPILWTGLLLVRAVAAQEPYTGGPRTPVSMYIWSDKYTYQPGEALKLKWTLKTNGDAYPFTVVAFRQNNQTGQRVYLPNNTEAATDLSGRSLSDGFAAAALTDAAKADLGSITVPDEPGMHTLTVQLRDAAGTRVIKAAYMKIGVVKQVVELSGDISESRTLTNDTQWNLKGVVAVKNNAVLTIEPGTFVIGQPGSQPPSVLLVTRNGRIAANGTKSRPIIMTSSQPFGRRSRGDWGGLVLLGKARVNVPANAAAGNTAGEFFIEGIPSQEDSRYGGSDDNHNCGSLKYVRLEYAGSILSPNNEINSFTWGGCGKATVTEHLQATNGLDDAFEWFGGTNDAKYLVGGTHADDYVDFQLGYTGRIQYGLFYQSPDAKGNRGIEGDNSEYGAGSTPFSDPVMYNMTFIGSGAVGFDEGNSPGLFLRRGARGSFHNMVVTNFFSAGVDLNDAATQTQADNGFIKWNGLMLWGNGLGTSAANTPEAQASNAFTQAFVKGERGAGNAKNVVAENPMLFRPFEFSDPDFSGRFGSPIFRTGFVAPPDDGFFDQTTKFIGGIGDEDWTEEWTSWLVDADIAP